MNTVTESNAAAALQQYRRKARRKPGFLLAEKVSPNGRKEEAGTGMF